MCSWKINQIFFSSYSIVFVSMATFVFNYNKQRKSDSIPRYKDTMDRPALRLDKWRKALKASVHLWGIPALSKRPSAQPNGSTILSLSVVSKKKRLTKILLIKLMIKWLHFLKTSSKNQAAALASCVDSLVGSALDHPYQKVISNTDISKHPCVFWCSISSSGY